ncbi:MAG TPA: hypothetical protein VNB90_00905 [Cytophagaceae bacterium]|nr:hypothetical protein [Cytophagaceae bacterium]
MLKVISEQEIQVLIFRISITANKLGMKRKKGKNTFSTPVNRKIDQDSPD